VKSAAFQALGHFDLTEAWMPARIRKLIGGVLMLVFLGGYAWAAATLFGFLPNRPAIQLIYVAVVGILWGVPLIPLISWMNRGR
jgi:hypothetical protein